MREYYANRKNRDERYKQLVAEYGKDKVYRESARNQLFHPMYVQDRQGGLTESDKGFGNSMYKTHFSVLYIVGLRS